MAFPSEHKAIVTSSEQFDQDSLSRINLDNGVDAIIGNANNSDKKTVLTYHFDSEIYNEQQAKEWLNKHEVAYTSFDIAVKSDSVYLLPINGVIGEDFTYRDLLLHLNSAKNYTTINLLINSVGGFVDEGINICEALTNSGKIITATNSGDIMSIAVSIFLTAPRQNRTFNPAKGKFLIHNPFADPSDLNFILDAETLSEMAKEMKSLENKIAKEYELKTGTPLDILKAFMNEEKYLSPEQIESLGFATIIKQPVKALALISLNKKDKMNEKEQGEKIGRIEAALNKLLKALFPAKNMILQDVNGNELDFGEAIQAPEQIIVGVEASVAGSPASGEFILEDGTTFKFEGGKLVEIIKPEPVENPESEMAKEIEALKAELAAKNLALTAMESAKNKAETDLENVRKDLKLISTDFTAFKNQFSKGDPAKVVTPEKTDEPKKGFSYKRK